MKRKLLLTTAILVVLGACYTQYIHSATEWRYHEGLFHNDTYPRVELGLREDGVVVWRKLEKQTKDIIVTNSPSESDKAIIHIWGTLTNSVVPNSFPIEQPSRKP